MSRSPEVKLDGSELYWRDDIMEVIFGGPNCGDRTSVDVFQRWMVTSKNNPSRFEGFPGLQKEIHGDRTTVSAIKKIEDLPSHPVVLRITAEYLRDHICVFCCETGLLSVYPPVLGPFHLNWGPLSKTKSIGDLAPSHDMKLPSLYIPEVTTHPGSIVVIRKMNGSTPMFLGSKFDHNLAPERNANHVPCPGLGLHPLNFVKDPVPRNPVYTHRSVGEMDGAEGGGAGYGAFPGEEIHHRGASSSGNVSQGINWAELLESCHHVQSFKPEEEEDGSNFKERVERFGSKLMPHFGYVIKTSI